MKNRRPVALASLVLALAFASPAFALTGFHPYLRIAQGGSGFRMADVNSNIKTSEAALQSSGASTDFHKVGSGIGPGGSAGLWLLPFLRVGATFATHRAKVDNYAEDLPSNFLYDDQLDLRVREYGVEAALRSARLWGLTVGGQYGPAHAEAVENIVMYAGGGQLFAQGIAKKDGFAYGGFVGFEQTNAAGFTGFLHAGFERRDIGHMPMTSTQSDGVTTVQSTGTTSWMDYSGYYVRVGVGFDLVH